MTPTLEHDSSHSSKIIIIIIMISEKEIQDTLKKKTSTFKYSSNCLKKKQTHLIFQRLLSFKYMSLEENVDKILSDIHHSRILHDPPSRILEIKAKINKWDLIKL